MTYEEAIRILHPDTTVAAIAEYEYYGGFHGKQAGVKAVEDACLVACEAMKKLLKKETNKKRQYQRYDSGNVWCYYNPYKRNPCGCGSNCYHYEYDGEKIYGVCNGCQTDVYEVKPEYIDGKLATGVWR